MITNFDPEPESIISPFGEINDEERKFIIQSMTNKVIVEELSGTYGNGFHKSLELHIEIKHIDLDPERYFQVLDHKVPIYKGPSLDEAIKVYNNI